MENTNVKLGALFQAGDNFITINKDGDRYSIDGVNITNGTIIEINNKKLKEIVEIINKMQRK